MTADYVRRIISSIRPNAKFVRIASSRDFMPEEANISTHFFQVALYDEDITSNHYESKKAVFIVNNSYLSSFAYNLALSWIYEMYGDRINPNEINPAVKYNFKKFFAEQLYCNLNNVFSRAILLETLLYEEPQMLPVFEEAKKNRAFSELSEKVSEIFSSLILFHETGHYYLKFMPATWSELFEKYKKILTPICNDVEMRYDEKFVEEVRCDIFAVMLQFLPDNIDKSTKKAMLQIIVFGFEAFAQLWSLKRAAEITCDQHREMVSEEIKFHSINRPQVEYMYQVPFKTIMNTRASIVTSLCEAIAENDGIELYGTDAVFPLPKQIGEYLFSCASQVMEGANEHQRIISKLIAEGMHDHPEGMEYIYLNSKVYKSKENNIDL